MEVLRTLHLTTPPLHGGDISALQQQLAAKRWLRGPVDGIYGPLTAQAVYRAKYWLGYATPDQTAADLLMSYLDGRRAQTPEMLNRVRRRMDASTSKPTREKALELLTGKLGVKENPPNSNVCWASEWYGLGPGPWCAMAVSWAYAMAGSRVFVPRQHYAFVPFIVADARAGRNHVTLTTEPQPGDLVCYDWPGESPGVADHVGLFAKWTDHAAGTFDAIEGNTAVGNDSNGGEVMLRHRSVGLVQAFVHVGA